MKRSSSLILFWLSLSAILCAQIRPTGSAEGLVKDPSGAVLSGARITVTNTQTGVARSSTTSELGHYVFPLLPPGPYRIEAERKGFQKYAQEFRVQTGVASTVNITMRLGEVKQVTEVTAVGAAVEAASASISAVITNRQVTDLPLAGRNPY